jgi:hypothetical protein
MVANEKPKKYIFNIYMPCLQVFLISGVAIMNSIAAYIQEWPKAYQIINIPHFLMYIVIIFFLCQNEFYTAAWVLLAIITLVTVDFIILSKKIFELEATMMSRLTKSCTPSSPQPLTNEPLQPVQEIRSNLEYAGMPINSVSPTTLATSAAITQMGYNASTNVAPINNVIGPIPVNSNTVLGRR